jgi:hypothetical protein
MVGAQDERGLQSAIRFFEQLLDGYARAEAAAGGPVDHDFLIAGQSVRLRLAGRLLEPYLLLPLGHLAAGPTATPSLTIHIWESESTGVGLPPPYWEWERFDVGGEIRDLTIHDRFRAMYQFGSGIFSLLDRERGIGFSCVRSAGLLTFQDLAAPLRGILQWWAEEHGMVPVHAAAVGLPSGGVLLPGKKGSGKSNTSLACLDSALRFAGDDVCLVSTGPQPEVSSLYSSAKTFPADFARLPFLGAWVTGAPRSVDGKLLYFLNRHVPERLIAGFSLKAIVVPRVTGRRDTSIVPISAAATMTALAPSSLILSPKLAEISFHALADVVRRVPTYMLELGTEVEQISATIHKLLST